MQLAIEQSNRKFNDLKDDTSVLVVELNPSNGAMPLAGAPGGGACCVVQ